MFILESLNTNDVIKHSLVYAETDYQPESVCASCVQPYTLLV